MSAVYLINVGLILIHFQLYYDSLNFYIFGIIQLLLSIFLTKGFEIDFGKKLKFWGYSKKDLYHTQNVTTYKNVDIQIRADKDFYADDYSQADEYVSNVNRETQTPHFDENWSE